MSVSTLSRTKHRDQLKQFEVDRLMKLLKLEADKLHLGRYQVHYLDEKFLVVFGSNTIDFEDPFFYIEVADSLKEAIINCLVDIDNRNARQKDGISDGHQRGVDYIHNQLFINNKCIRFKDFYIHYLNTCKSEKITPLLPSQFKKCLPPGTEISNLRSFEGDDLINVEVISNLFLVSHDLEPDSWNRQNEKHNIIIPFLKECDLHFDPNNTELIDLDIFFSIFLDWKNDKRILSDVDISKCYPLLYKVRTYNDFIYLITSFLLHYKFTCNINHKQLLRSNLLIRR